MNITEFLNNDYNDAALYMLYRNTPGYVDGLKNGARKAIYTVKKLGLKTPVKVTAFGGKVTDTAAYLHGDSGIQGATVTMAANYCGANNLPTLEGVGSFGTRFSNAASAARYIFVKPADYFDLLFRKEDDCNLEYQEFEGQEIEPAFYVPTLPLLLLNGSEGIGVGFANDFYPRSVENVIKLTKAAIAGKNLKSEWFVPAWHGFRGSVEKVEDAWIVKGIAELDGKKLTITELPIAWELKPYTKLLDKLKEEKLIARYNDYSEDDTFKFDIWLTEEELAKGKAQIWKDLGLVKSMTENYTVFDESNEVKDDYTDVKDIFKDYYKIKIKYMKLRIKSETARLTTEENALKETYKFIQEVIKGTIVLKNKKKAEAEAELKAKGYTIIDKLLAMPLYSLTIDKAKEIEKKWKDKIKELEAMKAATPESLWLKDIEELEAELKKTGVLGNGNKVSK